MGQRRNGYKGMPRDYRASNNNPRAPSHADTTAPHSSHIPIDYLRQVYRQLRAMNIYFGYNDGEFPRKHPPIDGQIANAKIRSDHLRDATMEEASITRSALGMDRFDLEFAISEANALRATVDSMSNAHGIDAKKYMPSNWKNGKA